MTSPDSGRAPGNPRASVAAHTLPLTALELMTRRFPELPTVLSAAIDELRASGLAEGEVLSPDRIIEVDAVQEFLNEFGQQAFERGADRADVAADANMLGTHTWHFLNFALQRRKLFWVDESLAWMLSQTRLDIEGRALRLPFRSFALVFTDRVALDLVDALLRANAQLDEIFSAAPRATSLTVHVTEVDGRAGGARAIGIDLGFFIDLGDGAWPYLFDRSLLIKPDDDLEAILDSHFPEVTRVGDADAFRLAELKALVQLVVNAILFTTSSTEPWRILRPAGQSALARGGWGKGKKQRAMQLRKTRSQEDAFHLPRRIPIALVRKLRETQRQGDGQMFVRFMVRGHWRRANPAWEDQRLRWIEPYWKGPDMATVVEREYVLKGHRPAADREKEP